jgi:hypothetical protein
MYAFLQSLLEKVGNSFLFTAFLPAIFFVVVSFVSLSPVLPQYIFLQFQGTIFQLIRATLVLLIFTLAISFPLYIMSSYIYKIFEGYIFILGKKGGLRDWFINRQRREFRKATIQKQLIERQLAKITSQLDYEIKNPVFGRWYARRLNRLVSRQRVFESKKYDITAYLEHNFPRDEGLIMPTRFGNILRAAENYPVLYGIDTVTIWGRLVAAIPSTAGITKQIEEANDRCQFLLNSAVLAILFAGICISMAIYEAILWGSITLGIHINHNGWLVITYILLIVLSIFVSRLFYLASLTNVSVFGDTIRTTCDLYRFELLKALHIELPATRKEEKEIWLKLSYLLSGNLEDYKETNYLTYDTLNIPYTHTPQ